MSWSDSEFLRLHLFSFSSQQEIRDVPAGVLHSSPGHTRGHLPTADARVGVCTRAHHLLTEEEPGQLLPLTYPHHSFLACPVLGSPPTISGSCTSLR